MIPDDLPDDVKPRIRAWVHEAVGEGVLPPSFNRKAVLTREKLKFLNHWHGVADGTKRKKPIPKNWFRAFQNWLLHAAEYEGWTGPGTVAHREGEAARMTEEIAGRLVKPDGQRLRRVK